MTRIKICGITNAQDAEVAAACGADAIGFVFARSPRQVAPERAREIMRGMDPFVVGVGVFVNAPAEEVRRILAFTGCSVTQLHGEEGPEYLEALAPLAVVKAIKVGAGERGAWAGRGDACAPRFKAILLDTSVPGKAGGTGKRFDLAAAQGMMEAGYRVIVAGGLTPENVAEVVRKARPYGVDVSTGVESSPGRKDHEKVRRFVDAVRQADRELGG
jgi:phosphoribosylanthranilate isomerase